MARGHVGRLAGIGIEVEPKLNLGQTMTTVKGSMVKLEGAMVKIG